MIGRPVNYDIKKVILEKAKNGLNDAQIAIELEKLINRKITRQAVRWHRTWKPLTKEVK